MRAILFRHTVSLNITRSLQAAHFYQRMFHHNPELKEIFNMSNQRNGNQREALFNTICVDRSPLCNLSRANYWNLG